MQLSAPLASISAGDIDPRPIKRITRRYSGSAWGRAGGQFGASALKLLLIPILLAFGVAGAGVGWAVGSRSLYVGDYDPLAPAMLRRHQVMAVVRRRKVRRLLLTLGYFFLGVLAGIAFLLYLSMRR